MRDVQTFNDGVVIIYRDASESSDNGAAINQTDIEQFEKVAKLRYENAVMRTEDLSYEEMREVTETMKIKVPRLRGLEAGLYGLVGNQLYYIYRCDPDKRKNVTYLFMTEARSDFGE